MSTDSAPAQARTEQEMRRGRGRPPGTNKERVSLRLDSDALAFFRADGPGWQSRVNAALRKAAGV